MISIATKALVTRAVAFASTLMMSLTIAGNLPKFKERRQRYFADAASSGSLSRMQLLHLAGANVNVSGPNQSPLLIAAAEGKLKAVRYLLDEGADVNAVGRDSNTALTEATFYGHAAIVKELLVRGANVNAISGNGTALDIAVSRNDPNMAELLKHYGGKQARELR